MSDSVKDEEMFLQPLDYEKLKEYGLKYIQQAGGRLWTDFNVHDPGVTILEALCFALTDLGYRTSFSINDLLTPEGEGHPRLDGSLFPAQEILPSNPVTMEDYRKYILEHVPGIRNIRFATKEKSFTVPSDVYVASASEDKPLNRNVSLKGYYDAIVELEEVELLLDPESTVPYVVGRKESGQYIEMTKKNYQACFQHYVRNFFIKHRNLCEDIDEVRILQPIYVGICTEIDISSDADYEEVNKEIYSRLRQYVTPPVKRYSLAEMIERGKTPQEIYSGLIPREGYGFIDPEELAHHEAKLELHISDIVNIVMDVPGVKSIRHLHFNVRDKDLPRFRIDHGSITLTDGSKYCLSFTPYGLTKKYNKNTSETVNQIVMFKNQIPFVPAMPSTFSVVADFLPGSIDARTDYPVPSGKNRNAGNYISFQSLLPQTYKIGYSGIAASAKVSRKASRLQLKAYLTFFDQLLADYLAQLNSLEELFSIRKNKSGTDRTMFYTRMVDDEVNEIDRLLKDYDSYGDSVESSEQALVRKQRILNHLLARFGESFSDYAALSFISKKTKSNKFKNTISIKEEIEDKKQLLMNYPAISRARSQGVDYTEPFCLSRLEQKILVKLGVNRPGVLVAPEMLVDEKGNPVRSPEGLVQFIDNRKKNYETGFGLHIIEHNLLFPKDAITKSSFLKLSETDDPFSSVLNPYSFRVTVVLPGWLDVCQNLYFRTFVENVIVEELPAHISCKICWIDPLAMWEYENSFKSFLKVMAVEPEPGLNTAQEVSVWKRRQREAVTELVGIMEGFRNIYPSIVLPDEKRIQDTTDVPLVGSVHIDNWDQDICGYVWTNEK